MAELTEVHMWKIQCEGKGESEHLLFMRGKRSGGCYSYLARFSDLEVGKVVLVGTAALCVSSGGANYLRGTLLLSPLEKSLLCRHLPSFLDFGAFLSWRT